MTDSESSHQTLTKRGDPEQLDREHEQLFHELRSILPGAEVLFAFLLTIAFTERFQTLTETQRSIYYAIFLLSGTALTLLLAPTAFHRVRFRRQDKEAMLKLANTEMIVAMVLMSLSISGVVFLITDLLFSSLAASLVSLTLVSSISALWWLVPLRRQFSQRSD
jgi:predicted membrane channel-forming protein YqfA (hemolysin III family)